MIKVVRVSTALRAEPTGKPSTFLLKDDEGTRGAPSWFTDWVRLGILAAGGSWHGPKGSQTVIAVSAPTKLLATAATAFGFAYRRYAAERTSCPPQLAISRRNLESGMRVWIRAPFSACAGTYTKDHPDRIRLNTGTFLANKVKDIRIIPDWANLQDGRGEFGFTRENSFINSIFPEINPGDFLTSWDWGLALVGSPEHLRSELQQEIAINATIPKFGSIKSVVRPIDEFAPTGWRSVIMSAWDSREAWETWPEPPQLVILAGAYAVSRWLPDCSSPLVIAILDRSEPGLEAAHSVLMQHYAFSTPIRANQNSWEPPTGCELLAFKRSL